MEEIDIKEVQESLAATGGPAGLATIWIIQRIEQMEEQLDELRFQLNSIEARINNLHESKFGV